MLLGVIALCFTLLTNVISSDMGKELKKRISVRQEKCVQGYCLPKCCPPGKIVRRTDLRNSFCVFSENDSIYKIDVYDLDQLSANVNLSTELRVVVGRPNCSLHVFDMIPLLVQRDGTLYLDMPDKQRNRKFTILHPDKFCIDTFINDLVPGGMVLNALVCSVQKSDDNHYVLSSTCMLISCFFILLTVGVYAWLPELRNLHGMILMAYLLSLFVAFLSLTTMQILILMDQHVMPACVVLSFFIYFFLLVAFFWLNVMCYDIWYTFSGKRGTSSLSSVRARFLRYCAYTIGVPTLLTVILAALEFSDPPYWVPMMPRLRRNGCFLYGKSKLLYLYGPITVVCVMNFIFFILTAFKIAKIKEQTKQILKSNDSSTHNQHKKDRQRLSLYLKLFAVMGFSWILEVISSFYPEGNTFWQITDAYNVLIGLIIFIIFVCKKKTLLKLKNRYRVMRGLPVSRTTNTTVSSRTLSSQSRDSIHMNPINKT